ncbi:hypothetical protein OHB04_08465 [Streptomyces sp. NBC_01775]|uniref:hypothetical protein n=1 Tax=Streptomyces sp. NBC_01775 TaxID=2975939 RepID=UPI002DD8713C|nr:hypothetical protein [Streptomyces sp. NBC_01775]WSB75818.1 hypothetical protein OHB04_08465 [Streptomyces sp. NBC_01775]
MTDPARRTEAPLHRDQPHALPAVTASIPTSGSPFLSVERTFRRLSRDPHRLTLPDPEASGAKGTEAARPLWQVRDWMVRQKPDSTARSQVWAGVIDRARREGEPWELAALGFALPVLHRTARRRRRPPGVERIDLEQEILTATLGALREPTTTPGRAELTLFRAADSAAQRLLRTERRHGGREEAGGGTSSVPPADAGEVASPGEGTSGMRHEFTVLADAVRSRLITVDEAQLIAGTRLGDASVRELAAERGYTRRTLCRRRQDAEVRLAEWLQPTDRPYAP